MNILNAVYNMMQLNKPTDKEILGFVKKGYHVVVAHNKCSW